MQNSTKKVQTRKTFEAFKEKPKTMLQVATETGILRGNICRYVASFEKHGKIVKVKQGTCPVSHHSAGFYSTDPKYFPDEIELELFPPTTKSRVYQL
jgi:hypothetical protein